MRKLLRNPRVGVAVADLCMYGMQAKGKDGVARPARKTTRFLSTSNAILSQLSNRCPGEHTHQHLVDGKAKNAALYPPQLCRAIIRGIEEEKQLEGECIPRSLLSSLESGCGLYNLMPEQMVLEEPGSGDLPHEQEALDKWYADGAKEFWDDISGKSLPPGLVQSARKEEIDFMQSWNVWREVPVAESWSATGKGPLGGRWVDVNKGDDQNPDVRCRWVAKDIAFTKTDEFFAAMPPIEALRMLLSFTASGRTHGGGGRKILIIDAKKAHLHAFPDRDVYVQLPPEISREGYCAYLLRCLYGTRDAPQRWEAFLASELKKHGFKQGVASTCVFTHDERDLRCVVHGDDFIFSGTSESLAWVTERMHESFLVKVVGQLGGDPGDLQEVRVLNRVLRWTPEGITYEADPRQLRCWWRTFLQQVVWSKQLV